MFSEVSRALGCQRLWAQDRKHQVAIASQGPPLSSQGPLLSSPLSHFSAAAPPLRPDLANLFSSAVEGPSALFVYGGIFAFVSFRVFPVGLVKGLVSAWV